jgi:hypothetical protein
MLHFRDFLCAIDNSSARRLHRPCPAQVLWRTCAPLVSCRGFADNFFRVIAHPPERWVGVTERAVLLAVHFPSWRGIWRYAGMQVIFFQMGKLPPVCEAVRRLWRVNVTPCQSSGEVASPASAVGPATHGMMGRRKSGRAYYAPLWWSFGGGGRKPTTGKKRKHGRLRFFLPLGLRPRAGGCPSPFEPFMKGLRRRERSGRGSKPNLLSFERGKPGGEGEGRWRPPKLHHRSTLVVKVTRPWAGLIRYASHGVSWCG